ncbi:MAG: hypothetical protein MI700_09570 [Balneolales bacterium]|nr:hypothetical protein [Balneolales bacterium]
MTRFFRDIRRRLIVPGNFRKYLIYAIGEILQVVIGILIALQASNRNTFFQQAREVQKLVASELTMLN